MQSENNLKSLKKAERNDPKNERTVYVCGEKFFCIDTRPFDRVGALYIRCRLLNKVYKQFPKDSIIHTGYFLQADGTANKPFIQLTPSKEYREKKKSKYKYQFPLVTKNQIEQYLELSSLLFPN